MTRGFIYHALGWLIMAVGLGSTSALAGDSAVQAACFAPTALAAVPGERQPARGIHTFDREPAPGAALAPFTPVPAAMRGAIRRVTLPKGENLIALTFDLCEQHGEVAGYDGDIFDYLRAQNIRATLFAGGKWMRSHPNRTQQLISDPLFEIANHTEAHRNLRLIGGPAIQTEITAPQRAYEAARRQLSEAQCTAPVSNAMAGIAPRLSLFRFPYGACNAASLNAVNDAGLLAIQWDLSSGDPDPRISASALANSIMQRVKPGSIIVSHGNGRGWNMAAALPLFVPKLKALGYQFVTVSELLARGTPVIADSCYDSKPGDTDRYDHPLGLTGVSKARGTAAGRVNWDAATTVTAKKRLRTSKDATKSAVPKVQPSKQRRTS